MKITAKSFPSVLLLLLTAVFAHAQRGNWNADPEQKAKEQTTEMTEKLSLSAKQAEKAGEINLKYANKMKDARQANPDANWEAMRENMMKLRQEQNTELKTVMTTAQFEQWEKIQAERQSQQKGRVEGRNGQRPKDKKDGDNQR